SLSCGPAGRPTSNLTVSTLRCSDRPFDIVLLVPESLPSLETLSLLRYALDCWAPYARAWRDPYCLQILSITRSRRTFESQNSASAMEHSWRSRVYILTTIVRTGRQAGRTRNFPAGVLPSTLRHLAYLPIQRSRSRSQSRRHRLASAFGN